ncbi:MULTISPECIES: hypothetical protein [unclassified Pseudofrankia]|uniref:hypothetical protein n=1 Tax=unclassified Pseudofrankia TaxID=2994372 RepID=UPI0018E33402|nr:MULTISPECIES: hypothetical protein [unclassified Pseudofrankia]MDT3439320.1 hypothetical protein [Pseudofrankia sp. BMG5.37]
MNRLLALVAAVDERPSLEETDAILEELCRMRRDDATQRLMDALLDYRTLLSSATT